MNIEFLGRNYEIDARIREHTAEKLERVLKFLDDPIEIHVTLETRKHQNVAEIHLDHRHGTVHTQETSLQMEESINGAVDKAEKQARRAKKKFLDKRRRAGHRENGHHWPIDVVDAESLRDGKGQRRIIKSTRLQIKPMSLEEAALQLDGSKSEFVVFRDADTDSVSVLYRRKDQNYGLISPEI
ncbi:MAG: ribosome-associated translation inhibitor RaiA [Thermoanaerobaculia bacterium]|nr:ribosome-associated translation inhibitor RaiA [Thermoanaerobaculia bacterium]